MNSENNENLPEKIKEWLERQGHSLEMRVAKAFRENGFTVSQYEHYVDQESQSVRQVDVVAYLSREIGNCFITAKLVIECKYAKSKPWVILLAPQKFDKFAFFSRILKGKYPSDWKNLPTLQGRLVAKILLSLAKISDLAPFAIGTAGYTVMESTLKPDQDPKQKDNAFEATVQVSKSVEACDVENEQIFKNCVEIAEHGQESLTGISDGVLRLYVSIAIPMIVINGRLFESHLSQNNEIDVCEIDNGFVLVPYRQHETHPNLQVPLSPVIVTTENSLNKFIPKIRIMLETLIEQDAAIRELYEYEQAKISKLNPDDGF